MKKQETIKSKEEFNNIIKNGKVLATSGFLIYYLKSNNERPKFGIAVSKKIGNAVVRNKLKRQYRNIIDQNKILFSNNYNYIIMIKKASLSLPFSELSSEFGETLEKVDYEKDK